MIKHLKKDICMKRLEISSIENHELEVQNLKSSISIWKLGCQQALEELQSKIEPHQNYESILQHLNLPINLVELDD